MATIAPGFAFAQCRATDIAHFGLNFQASVFSSVRGA